MMAEKSYSRSQMIGKVILFLVLCIFAIILFIPLYWMVPVSYTHLDVYKRQVQEYIPDARK